ncbi:MAG: repeat protein [Solirubrobacterales bacterium]|nr:repeat protein [Solirubrobacterales bacterium]
MRATLVAVGVALVVAGGATGTAQAAISIDGPATFAEPSSDTATATYTVTRPLLSVLPGSVTLTTTDVTATSPADYDGGTLRADFTLGSSIATVTIPVAADNLDEDAETFTVTMTATTTDTIDPAADSITTTITDDEADGPPAVAVGTAPAVAEGTGTSGSGLAFPVTLSGPSGRAVSVAYATSGTTATSATDYTATAGTLTIPAGQTTGTIMVPVVPDALDEDDESLSVTLSAPVNTSITTATATGTIADDDTATITVTGASVLEGAAGATTVTNALVNLSVASARNVTVSYATANGTATAPADYRTAAGQVTVAAGQRTAVIPLAIVGDALTEADEAFGVGLSGPVGAAIAPNGGVAAIIIRNDDGPGGISVPPGQQGTVVTKPTGSGTLPGTGGRSTTGIALGALRFARSTGQMRFVVSCPAASGRCKGTVTVFSVPVAKSKVRPLRHEQQFATKRFDVVGGAKLTVAMRLSARSRSWVRQARTVRITAYAVSRDATGGYSTAKVPGTLKR